MFVIVFVFVARVEGSTPLHGVPELLTPYSALLCSMDV